MLQEDIIKSHKIIEDLKMKLEESKGKNEGLMFEIVKIKETKQYLNKKLKEIENDKENLEKRIEKSSKQLGEHKKL